MRADHPWPVEHRGPHTPIKVVVYLTKESNRCKKLQNNIEAINNSYNLSVKYKKIFDIYE